MNHNTTFVPLLAADFCSIFGQISYRLYVLVYCPPDFNEVTNSAWRIHVKITQDLRPSSNFTCGNCLEHVCANFPLVWGWMYANSLRTSHRHAKSINVGIPLLRHGYAASKSDLAGIQSTADTHRGTDLSMLSYFCLPSI